MGSDDLFHKRKARSARDLKRQEALRDSYDRALIVCEGEKTEPSYFREWQRALRINHANLEIIGDCDSDPLRVVERAITEARRDGEFDKVFCVFDRDQHPTYDEAIAEIESQDTRVFKTIRSVPCFEYWLLLHFEYSSQPMSAADALNVVQRYVPDYCKNASGIQIATADSLDTATQRARAIRKDGQRGNFDNPYTNVDVLVNYLRGFRA